MEQWKIAGIFLLGYACVVVGYWLKSLEVGPFDIPPQTEPDTVENRARGAGL